MKDFLKYVFATVVGIGLAMLLMSVVFFVSVIGMAANEGATTPVKKNSVLRINLSGSLEERSDGQDPLSLAMSNLMGGDDGVLALDQLLEAVEEAATNDKVEGIYMEIGSSFGGTPAMMQELRQALVKYKESGKWILTYGDIYGQGAYYLASLADKIVLNPKGIVDWHGLGGNPVFYTDVMKKAGVKMQVFKVGTFKSAVEPYINTEMSAANRKQVTSYLNSIWSQFVAEVGESRRLTADQLNALADTMPALQPTEFALTSGLVDTLAYIDGFKEMLRARLGLKEKKDINFVSPADLVASADKKDEKARIAVYYAFGDIVDQANNNPITGGGGPAIETMPTIRELQKLRKDEDVKAVVIRVNSGGGSAFASEQIWHEVELLKAEKPVVISMGGMAASGGYYISCGANKIISEPMTLTGSIGIFGMIPDASELLTEKLGLTFDVVKTNAMSDFGATGRPFNAGESAKMQNFVNRGYELFTSRVAGGRGLAQDSVKVVGEGRVWTGEQALKIGLVDQLGNLDDAVKAAAELAELEKYSIGRYPSPEPWYMGIINKSSNEYMESQMRAALGEFYPAFALVRRIGKMNPVQARIPFEPNIK